MLMLMLSVCTLACWCFPQFNTTRLICGSTLNQCYQMWPKRHTDFHLYKGETKGHVWDSIVFFRIAELVAKRQKVKIILFPERTFKMLIFEQLQPFDPSISSCEAVLLAMPWTTVASTNLQYCRRLASCRCWLLKPFEFRFINWAPIHCFRAFYRWYGM